jgi:hypothetical protein
MGTRTKIEGAIERSRLDGVLTETGPVKPPSPVALEAARAWLAENLSAQYVDYYAPDLAREIEHAHRSGGTLDHGTPRHEAEKHAAKRRRAVSVLRYASRLLGALATFLAEIDRSDEKEREPVPLPWADDEPTIQRRTGEGGGGS